LDKFEKYLPVIKKYDPDFRFSWQISTEIIEQQLEKKTYWLDIGARDNYRLEVHSQANLGVGLDLEKEGEVYRDANNSFCLGSTYQLPFKNNSFDFVASRFTFEHLEEPIKALMEVALVLKPGGIFLLETTNKNNPLIIISSLIPFPIKKYIIKKLFKENPSGTYKTFYRINTPSSYRKLDLSDQGLILDKLYIVNDIFCESKLLFAISFGLYKFMRLFGLNSLYSNILAVFRKIQ
jgi:SAM-dependent methyltransferase